MQLNPSEIGPRSPDHRLRRLDRRTREGKFLAETERALIAHCGGPERVTATQRILIERTAADLLRLELLDEKMLAGIMSEHDGRVAHALRNATRLALVALGLDRAADPPKTVDELLNELTGGLVE